jgi:hypothetical protein
MPKTDPKHPRDMTADEVIAHVFHPKAVKHVKEHLAKLEAEKPKRTKKPSK